MPALLLPLLLGWLLLAAAAADPAGGCSTMLYTGTP
jgi:hypothetical protein